MTATPPRDSPRSTPDSSGSAPFPLGLAVACIIATSLGLCASALGVKWGAAPPPGDALPFAWLYVNIMLLLTWLIVWPALRISTPSAGGLYDNLLFDFAAIGVAAIPAMGVASFLSGVTVPSLLISLIIQGNIALLSRGAIALAIAKPRFAGFLATSLAAFAVATPVLAYLWSEFFPMAANPWPALSPVLAIVHPEVQVGTPYFWLGLSIWSAIALILTVTGFRAAASAPAAAHPPPPPASVP